LGVERRVIDEQMVDVMAIAQGTVLSVMMQMARD
jgi:hypothetical protein